MSISINGATFSPISRAVDDKNNKFVSGSITDPNKEVFKYNDIDNPRKTTTFSNLAAKTTPRTVENPDGKLDGDDFLKLFLESLKYQDPTSPVETKDMMAQTAQLTTVETNVANKKALEAVTNTLTKSSQYQSQFGLLPAIGKLAIIKDDTVQYDGISDKDFQLYFENPPASGSIAIYDSNNNKVREISLLQYTNEVGEVGEDEKGLKIKDSTGMLSFTWDGRSDDGSKLAKGKYTIKANYVGQDAKSHNINLGTNIVESVKFDGTEPLLQLGGKYIKFSEVSEIR